MSNRRGRLNGYQQDARDLHATGMHPSPNVLALLPWIYQNRHPRIWSEQLAPLTPLRPWIDTLPKLGFRAADRWAWTMGMAHELAIFTQNRATAVLGQFERLFLEKNMPLSGEIDFDQTERITHRLSHLVRSYPKGVGIVKEFLQNADDAGASVLKVILDRRTHQGPLPKPEMGAVLGPALLFFNDSKFTKKDRDRIQAIGSGDKVADAARTGRFGQGFNTSYSVSDYPSLLTGDWIAWFDPHHWNIGSWKNEERRNARAFKLDFAKAELESWVRTFDLSCIDNDFMNLSANTFEGTIFRLPLRNEKEAEKSEIFQEPFSDSDFEGILEGLSEFGPSLLLFLRSVLKLEVIEISETGKPCTRAAYRTRNDDEVDPQKEILRDEVFGNPSDLLEEMLHTGRELPQIKYRHIFEIIEDGKPRDDEEWMVCNGLHRGPDDVLLKSALEVCGRREKALPWAGAAYPLTLSKKRRSGGLSCFLPLQAKNAMPVWLHGWFDLDSSRHDITRAAEQGAAAKARFDWNVDLMQHAVGPVWAHLVESLGLNVHSEGPGYELWPDLEGDRLAEALRSGFYRAAANLKVFRIRNATGFDIKPLTDNLIDLCTLKAHNEIADPLLAEGWNLLAPPLPSHVNKGLKTVGCEVPKLTPARLREYLRQISDDDVDCEIVQAPIPMLRREDWITSLSVYCANGDISQLQHLPLARLRDGKLHTYNILGNIYLEDESVRILLSGLPFRRFDQQYANSVEVKEQNEDVRVYAFGIDGFIECARELQSRESQPDNAWLVNAFRFLQRQHPRAIAETELQKIPLLPRQGGVLTSLNSRETALLPAKGTEKYVPLLRRIGIPIFDGDESLRRSVDDFRKIHQHQIEELCPREVAGCLASLDGPLEKLGDLEDQDLEFILDYLAAEDWSEDTRFDHNILRKKLPLLTSSGRRVFAYQENVFAAGTASPPPSVLSEFHILDGGRNRPRNQLYRSLDVQTLDNVRLICDYVVPKLSGVNTDTDYWQLLDWLVMEVPRELEKASDEKEAELRNAIRCAEFLPLDGLSGEIGSPKESYLIKDEGRRANLRALLTDQVGFVRLNPVEISSQERWMQFLESINVPMAPLPEHLLDAVVEAASSWSREEKPATNRIQGLLREIESRWDELAEQPFKKSTFRQAIGDISWLPPRPLDWVNKSDKARILQKPNAIFSPNQRDYIGSVAPVLAFPLAATKAEELGLQTRPDFSQIAQHFLNVQQVQPSTQSEEDWKRLDVSTQRIYSYFIARFRIHDSPSRFDGKKLGWNYDPEHGCWDVGRCKPLLLDKEWFHPITVFSDPIYLPDNPWIRGLEPTWSKARIEGVNSFLKLIGVRDRPVTADWFRLLNGLGRQTGDALLTDDQRSLSLKAIRQLGESSSAEIEGENTYLITTAGSLAPSNKCYVLDDPRVDASNTSKIPFVLQELTVEHLARRLGVRRLSDEIREFDMTGIRVEIRGEKLNEAKKYKHLISMREFSIAMARLRFHYRDQDGSEQGHSSVEDLLDETFDVAANLNWHFYKELSVSLFLPRESIHLTRVPCEYVYEAMSKDLHVELDEIEDELKVGLAEAFCPEGPHDSVGKLIGKMCRRPENIAGILERAGIRIHADKVEEIQEFVSEEGPRLDAVDPIQDAGEDQKEDASQVEEYLTAGSESVLQPRSKNETASDAASDGDREVPAKQVTEESVAKKQGSTSNAKQSSGERQERSSPSERNQPDRGPYDSPERDGIDLDLAELQGLIEEFLEEDADQEDRGRPRSRTPASGSNQHTEPRRPLKQREGAGGMQHTQDRTVKKRRRQSESASRRAPQSRLRTYVSLGATSKSEQAQEQNERRLETGRVGESAVMKWEDDHNRHPTQMPNNNPGFDIVSYDRDGTPRYIEVKAMRGAWGLRGVGVSRTQFWSALKHAENWWLYIVEYAGSGNDLIHVFSNPFLEENIEFRFDDGWKIILGKVSSHTPHPQHVRHRQDTRNRPIVGARYQTLGGKWVTVRSVEERDNGFLVSLEEHLPKMMWSPRWKRG